MNRNRKSPAALEKECADFNARVPVGGKVRVAIDFQDPIETTTRSAAEVLSGHTAVVWLDGVRGCYALSHVTPLEGGA